VLTLNADGTRESETVGGVLRNYSYTPHGELQSVTEGTTEVAHWNYLADGRVSQRIIGASSTQFSWNAFGSLVAATTAGGAASYEYDGLGLRRKATVGGVVREWSWVGESPVAENDELLAQVGPYLVAQADVSFQHDALGSIVGQSGLPPRAPPLTSTAEYGTWGAQSGGPQVTSNGFTGHRQEDALGGLAYAQQRWLDPQFGIFLSRDSVGADSRLESPNGMGPWSYANLNPARYTDPTGRDASCLSSSNRFGDESIDACHARVGNAAARQRDTSGNFTLAPEEQAAASRQSARGVRSSNVGGQLCDVYCLAGLDDQGMYSFGGEGGYASGASIKNAWQSAPTPGADYSNWSSQWTGSRSSAGLTELKREQFRHDRESLPPGQGAMLGAWQYHQARVSYFKLNRDNQGAWEEEGFDWSQEAGGHDLGMALTGEGYFEEQFSDEERQSLAMSGGKKLIDKSVEYGGALSLLGSLRVTVGVKKLVDADVIAKAMNGDGRAQLALNILGGNGRVTGRTIGEVMKGGAGGAISRAEVKAFMKTNQLKFVQSNFKAGAEAAKTLGRSFERTAGHFGDTLQLGTAQSKGLGFLTYGDGRAMSGAIRLGIDAHIISAGPRAIGKIQGALQLTGSKAPASDFFFLP
jgi:RHS repeat-associated protein